MVEKDVWAKGNRQIQGSTKTAVNLVRKAKQNFGEKKITGKREG
jgi:hypothetical protein